MRLFREIQGLEQQRRRLGTDPGGRRDDVCWIDAVFLVHDKLAGTDDRGEIARIHLVGEGHAREGGVGGGVGVLAADNGVGDLAAGGDDQEQFLGVVVHFVGMVEGFEDFEGEVHEVGILGGGLGERVLDHAGEKGEEC